MRMDSDLAAWLKTIERCGLYRAPEQIMLQLSDAARTAGLKYYAVELTGCPDKRSVLAALARDLQLPEWFGFNWDALEEVLADLEPCVIVLHGLEDLGRKSPCDLALALDLFRSVVDEQRQSGRSMWVFVGMQADPSIPACSE